LIGSTNCVQPRAGRARNWRACVDPVPPRGFVPPGRRPLC